MGQTAVYFRVSSRGQDFATQRDAVMKVAPAEASVYQEKASAKTKDRPELSRLLADVRAGIVDRVITFKLDRLTRSGVADTFAVVDAIRKAGATLHCVADGLVVKPGEDVTSDVLVFALGLAAKLERTAKNDRIAAARTRLEAKGEAWGRPARVTPAQLDTIKRMRAKGDSVRTIAAALGVPRSTIGRAVKELGS